MKNDNEAMKHRKSIFLEKYGAASPEPPDDLFFRKLFDIKLNLVKDRIEKGMTIVDAGCGNGSYIYGLYETVQQKESHLIGVDFGQKYLDQIRIESSHISKICNDVMDMKDVPNECDIVYSFATLYTLLDVRKAVTKIYNKLKDNGTAIIDVGNINSLGALEAKIITDPRLCNNINIPEFIDWVNTVGFKITDYRCFQLFPNYNVSPITPSVKDFMLQSFEGIIFDEWISSDPFMRSYSYRHLFIMKKEKGDHSYNIRLTSQSPDTWTSKELISILEKAKSIFIEDNNNVNKSLEIIFKEIKKDIFNPVIISYLMYVYSFHNEELLNFTEKFISDINDFTETILPTSDIDEKIEHESELKFKSKKPYPVSIVLPTYNQANMLGKCIQSLEAQTYKDFELIIVNDGSTDDTEDYLSTIQQEFTECKVIVIHQENKKLPGALNAGFRKAKGDYLTWVSSDCYCAPNMIETLVNALNSEPTTTGMAYSEFYLMDEQDKITQKVANPNYSYRTLLIRNDGNASFMYRRECMNKIGMYDEELNGAEDWDYWIRIAEHFDFMYIPEPLYYYRLHPKSMQQTIPQEVNESIFKMFDKITKRSGTSVDLRKLYPGLPTCYDQKRAVTIAAIDFGTLLIYSRINRMQTAALFLGKAIQEIPELHIGWLNLAIAHACMNKWDMVKTCMDHLQEVYDRMDEVMQKMFDFAKEIFKEEDQNSVKKIPLLTYQDISKNEELYLKEEIQRRVYIP